MKLISSLSSSTWLCILLFTHRPPTHPLQWISCVKTCINAMYRSCTNPITTCWVQCWSRWGRSLKVLWVKMVGILMSGLFETSPIGKWELTLEFYFALHNTPVLVWVTISKYECTPLNSSFLEDLMSWSWCYNKVLWHVIHSCNDTLTVVKYIVPIRSAGSEGTALKRLLFRSQEWRFIISNIFLCWHDPIWPVAFV